ncbi:hypothetical protein MYA_0152 [Burkholderia sp. KJ006]|nr:hypothetical protein MYA_0152 [Burkholderia sp. KJ006]
MAQVVHCADPAGGLPEIRREYVVRAVESRKDARTAVRQARFVSRHRYRVR